MISKLWKGFRIVVVLIALYIIFSVTTILMPLWFLLLLCVARGSQAMNVLKSMDRLAAAAIGFDGRSTISRECGLCDDCWLCKPICAVLAWALGEPHCEIAVRKG